MNGIVLEGQIAVEEHKRLLNDGTEINVGMRERDAGGKKKSTWLQFGMDGSVAWVFFRVEEKGVEPRVVLEEVLAHEAAELFGSYLDRMTLRRCLVDPSPLSPEMVEISPCLEDVAQDLEAEFGITVPLS